MNINNLIYQAVKNLQIRDLGLVCEKPRTDCQVSMKTISNEYWGNISTFTIFNGKLLVEQVVDGRVLPFVEFNSLDLDLNTKNSLLEDLLNYHEPKVKTYKKLLLKEYCQVIREYLLLSKKEFLTIEDKGIDIKSFDIIKPYCVEQFKDFYGIALSPTDTYGLQLIFNNDEDNDFNINGKLYSTVWLNSEDEELLINMALIEKIYHICVVELKVLKSYNL